MDGSPLLDPVVCGRRELEGWRVVRELNPLAYPAVDFQTHLAPAFAYGVFARLAWRDSTWNTDLEAELAEEWPAHRAASVLPWSLARSIVRQGFEGFRGPRATAVVAPPQRSRSRIEICLAWLARKLFVGRGMRTTA